ncbi:carboxylesterase [Teratosphaeria destructans]|uniref:Carboxylic ester hydrolase n=1 Tax=Teratosphaeria destructans TaxID=418781 RepID=A0A9W7SPF3_9PEZI|nr:carboxylesterase [Teratosphaeria destructans]
MTADAHLPVAFFMTGGAFQTGGIDIPGQIPAAWVNRTQEHIVVTINYRVNIFGFPNAAGSSSANVGILDQRMALEWVAHNIASFGGDPKRILLWGQSAGAQSVDYHNYAFWNDPISHASFSESGTALKSTTSEDHAKTNFTFVAKSLGCDFASNPQAEMECMQRLPFQLIEDFLGDYNGTKALTFGPVADEVLIFSNYTERATKGYISPSPAIFSDAANNDVALLPWPAKNETAVIEGTLKDWVCPTAQTSILRQQAGRITYRAQYAGNFSNETPYPYLGAYHCADLMMYFGTYGLNATNATTGVTRLERETSEAMQDRLLAFAKDPVNGLVRFEWERYEQGGKAVRFGADRRAVQEINVDEIDDACFGNGTYNAYP